MELWSIVAGIEPAVAPKDLPGAIMTSINLSEVGATAKRVKPFPLRMVAPNTKVNSARIRYVCNYGDGWCNKAAISSELRN